MAAIALDGQGKAARTDVLRDLASGALAALKARPALALSVALVAAIDSSPARSTRTRAAPCRSSRSRSSAGR